MFHAKHYTFVVTYIAAFIFLDSRHNKKIVIYVKHNIFDLTTICKHNSIRKEFEIPTL